MTDTCFKCDKPLLPGQWVYQLARGIYYFPHPTPTYLWPDAILAEWHFDCFDKALLNRQEQMYRCATCRETITSHAAVVYGVIGLRPQRGYIRPEHRGYELWFVIHDRCWEELKSRIVSAQSGASNPAEHTAQ